MNFSADELSQIFLSMGAMMLAGSAGVVVLTAALRFGVRPLLGDWAKLRIHEATSMTAQRLVELEDEVRRLRRDANLHLPVEVARPAVRSFT